RHLHEDVPAERFRSHGKAATLIRSESYVSVADLLSKDDDFPQVNIRRLRVAAGSSNRQSKRPEMKMDPNRLAARKAIMPTIRFCPLRAADSSFWTIRGPREGEQSVGNDAGRGCCGVCVSGGSPKMEDR